MTPLLPVGVEPDPDFYPIVLDPDHRCGFRGSLADGAPLLLVEYHRRADGTWCGGSCPLWPYVGPLGASWELVSAEPLTLRGAPGRTDSLRCPRCGNHGWIRNGQWVEA